MLEFLVANLMLEHYNVKIDNNQGYDYIYVANMCKADFLEVVLLMKLIYVYMLKMLLMI